PLIALIGILLVVLVGTLIALFAQPDPPVDPDPSTSPSPSVSTSPSPEPSPSPDVVNVVLEDYLGMTESEVRTALGDLGLVVNVSTGSAASNPADVGKVYSVNPTGPLTKGDVVNVLIRDQVPTPAKPGALTPDSSTGPAGSTITISWAPYVCPSGLNFV